jgi:hypothetical protein
MTILQQVKCHTANIYSANNGTTQSFNTCRQNTWKGINNCSGNIISSSWIIDQRKLCTMPKKIPLIILGNGQPKKAITVPYHP